MKICTVTEMRAIDLAAAKNFGIPPSILMENAGISAANLLRAKTANQLKSISVVCGPGNNGGDGFVVARQMQALGYQVKILLLTAPDKYNGEALLNYKLTQNLGIETSCITQADEFLPQLNNSDIIVDAIFGTGLTRPAEHLFLAAIQAINQTNIPILSLDIPSGINGDTAQVMGTAIQATWTVTFGAPKIGNLIFPGYKYNGELFVCQISLPKELLQAQHIQQAVNDPPRLPSRVENGHKGTFGQALFIAGASNYYGAPYFSAFSFLKAGGGYSRLASPKSITPFIASKGSEIVFLPQNETDAGSLSLSNLAPLLELANKLDVTILGPGISLFPETQELARLLIPSIKKPILVDGDGLTALSHNMSLLKEREAPTILTPHLGEMSRLTNTNRKEIELDLVNSVRNFCQKWQVHIVLKGAHSLIGYPNGNVYINLTGNSGMATAGSGDVLTGTIAAMYCLGLEIGDAIRMGVFMHGFAGDLAAQAIGEDGITAHDILYALPQVMKMERSNQIAAKYPRYFGPKHI